MDKYALRLVYQYRVLKRVLYHLRAMSICACNSYAVRGPLLLISTAVESVHQAVEPARGPLSKRVYTRNKDVYSVTRGAIHHHGDDG